MPIKRTADIVDLGLAYTFPASDPPSYMATAVPGVPPRCEPLLTSQKKREAEAACAEGELDAEL